MTRTERAKLMAEYKALKAIPVDYSKFKPTGKNHAQTIFGTTLVSFAIFVATFLLGAVISGALGFGIPGVYSVLGITLIIACVFGKHFYPFMLKKTYVPESGEEKTRFDRIQCLEQLLFPNREQSGCSINPATGLPITSGAIDIAGNPYGTG